MKNVEKDNKGYVQILKAMADETRMEIIEMLSAGELCACKILENFNFTQPTLSYHMKILTECGLVEGIRVGAWMRYSLKKETFAELQKLYNHFCDSISEKKIINCCED